MLPPTDPDPSPLTPEPTPAAPEPPAPDATPAAPGHAAPEVTRRRRPGVRRLAIVGGLVLAFVVGLGVDRVASLAADGALTAPGSGATDFGLIREAWDTIHSKYVRRDQLDDRALIYGAIEGMADAVGDTGHTSFMTPEERAERSRDLSGSYVGIGVRLDIDEDGRPVIIGVFDGSPAAKAGVKVGDVIESVDGRDTAGRTMDDVAGWVRGEAGTDVTIVVRQGDEPARTLKMARADVPLVSVTWTMVPGGRTALMRLESFSSGAADQVVAALKEVKDAGADRLVLDLRGNPGGYVNEAVGVASQFLKDGLVYIERNADGEETKHEVSPDGVALDIPLVVLVDGNTASSAEIVSGALQDHDRAEIEGVPTFGTGTVLGEFALSDGSALRVGTTEWLTPNGRRIWHEGITPDVVVERTGDTALLTPDDVRDLTPAQVDAIDDAQLASALSAAASNR